jgi:hypothetical protein
MEAIARESWEFVIRDLLRAYQHGYPPFDSASLYVADLDPWDNDALNAKLDLERATGAGCRNAKSIVEFLNILEEGWFFEEKAGFYELLREYLAQGGTLPGAIPGECPEP